MLYVFADFAQAILFYLFFCSKEYFSLSCSLGYVLVNINTNKNSHLVNIVQEWAQGKISRCTQKANYRIKILDMIVML